MISVSTLEKKGGLLERQDYFSKTLFSICYINTKSLSVT